MALANQKIKFLQGTQDALNGLIANGGAKEGSFYLTNDTHRLYVGKTVGAKTVPVAVNEGVVTVANIAALPLSGVNAGEFYYATQENILCVYNGSQFVQINTDKNTTLKENEIAVELDETNNSAKITQTITDSEGDTYVDYLTLKDSVGSNKIEVTSEKRDTGKKDENGQPIMVDDYTIDIKGDQYSIGADVSGKVATIALTSANTDNDTSFAIEAGTNVEITETADGKGIVIASSYEDTKIKTIEFDYNGFKEDGDGTLLLKITDTDGDPYEASVNLGKYYTEEEIDAKFRNLNGMKYQGTAGNEPLPTENVKSGYTYMVDKDGFKVGTITANIGDLLIASGEEDNDGYIPTENIVWNHIPSGDDTELDTTYLFTNLTHGKELVNQVTKDPEGSFVLTEGTAITLTDTVDGNDLSIEIKHNDIEHTENSSDPTDKGTGLTTITAVSGVTVNEQGHVTDVSYGQYGILDTTYELSGAEVAVDKTNNTVTITDSLTNLVTEDPAGTSVTSITSETLTFNTVENNTAAYNVEITWGSF